jgi:hypothetical protein
VRGQRRLCDRQIVEQAVEVLLQVFEQRAHEVVHASALCASRATVAVVADAQLGRAPFLPHDRLDPISSVTRTPW